MIELVNVSKKYKDGTHALYDINLKVEEGEFVFIMGPTGSGKSTLVKLLDGEEVPSSGKVLVGGINVGRLRKSKVYLYRRKIGVVFQDYRLLPEKTAFENIAYALEILDMPAEKIKKRVRDVLKLVGLSDKSNSKPKALSGGQQQRVAIARAVAKKPMIIIADEPTGNLDPEMTDDMITLLEKINQEEKTTIIVVTHEISTVEKHPKRTIRIENGHLVSDSIYKPKNKKEVEETVTADPEQDGLLFKVDGDEEEETQNAVNENDEINETVPEEQPSAEPETKESTKINTDDITAILDEAAMDIASTLELFSMDDKTKEEE